MPNPQPNALLASKLYIPPQRPNLVTRHNLLQKLDAALRPEVRLILVCAPAGFGKTTLLSHWVTQTQSPNVTASGTKQSPSNLEIASRKALAMTGRGDFDNTRPVAWLSLDEGDNDLIRCLTYLIAALQRVNPGLGEVALSMLQTPQPPAIEPILTALINDLSESTNSFVLILDDYHVIKSRPIHDAIIFLIDHLPTPMHLVIATRADPPIPLARLRGRMQLVELRAADLRFAGDEVATFLNQVMALNLSGDDVAGLEARTEGWIVGLQLAALSMQGRDDPAGFIAAFSGSHHYVLDYLIEQVLHGLPEYVQTFLLHTSILDRMCGSLCDAVLGQKDEGGRIKDEKDSHSEVSSLILHAERSSFILEYLERNNLFIVPLDDERRWYRYHHLFADLLRNQLGRRAADQIPELHRRASLWHERNGLTSEAVNHALLARDWERAADLIEQHALALLNRGELTTLLGWLTALPEMEMLTRTRLCLYHAWVLTLTGRFDAAEARLQRVAKTLDSSTVQGREMLGHIVALRANAAAHHGDATRATLLAREALQYLPDDDLQTRCVVDSILGSALLLTGDVKGACQVLAEAGRIGQVSGNLLLSIGALSTLGGQQIVLGQLHQAAETYEDVLRLSAGRDKHSKPLPPAARAYMGLSELHYEWNDLESATRFAEECFELSRYWEYPDALARMPLAMARMRLARGDVVGAYEAFQQAEKIAKQHRTDPWAVDRLEQFRVRLWLAPEGGNLAAATRWAETRASALEANAELPYVREREHLALARVLIAEARFDQALGLLNRLNASANAGGRIGRVIETLVLEAVTMQLKDARDAAISALGQAMTLAEPAGYVRTFVDAGEPMRLLLERMNASREGRGMKEYIRQLLVAFGRVKEIHPSVEPLSARELEVLRAIADGMSNAEIAQRLVIEVSTVKRHINHIFSKLGVTTRIQAIVKARGIGLL
ncbi:MAG: LuxR family transcriptional regulator [Chloroflexi bacterium]|nr:LuxR family transcriptional regulator [Chloroflexota bacterium]